MTNLSKLSALAAWLKRIDDLAALHRGWRLASLAPYSNRAALATAESWMGRELVEILPVVTPAAGERALTEPPERSA